MSSPISLGDLIVLLKHREQDQEVRIAFGYFSPDGVHSYRGFYEQLAIGYSYESGKEVKVAELLKELQGAIGKTFHGYKGGEYVMTECTPVWCANHGEAPSVAIVGIADCNYCTILRTDYCGC